MNGYTIRFSMKGIDPNAYIHVSRDALPPILRLLSWEDWKL